MASMNEFLPEETTYDHVFMPTEEHPGSEFADRVADDFIEEMERIHKFVNKSRDITTHIEIAPEVMLEVTASQLAEKKITLERASEAGHWLISFFQEHKKGTKAAAATLTTVMITGAAIIQAKKRAR